MTATTIGRWGKLRILVFGVNSSQKINIYHWKCVGKSFWENGMNVACGMEMSISGSRGVLRCMLEMKEKCSVRFRGEERTRSRNEMETEWNAYTASP
jgi:hypothetical protein